MAPFPVNCTFIFSTERVRNTGRFRRSALPLPLINSFIYTDHNSDLEETAGVLAISVSSVKVRLQRPISGCKRSFA